MLETPHVIVGAAIATKVANPALALPLAFMSHFVLDKTPHWNPHLNTEVDNNDKVSRRSTNIVIADVTLSLISGAFIASKVLPNINHALTILAACFFSVLPDIVEGPYFFLNIRNKTVKKWIIFQKSIQENAPLVPGLATQLLTIFVSFWWIYN